jgi:hypothetical protein
LNQAVASESERARSAVLLVGDAEPFDLEMPAYYNTCFDDCLLCVLMLGKSPDGKSPDERREELASRRIVWVLVDWPEIERYRSPGNYGFDPRFTPELLTELVAQGVLGPPLQFGSDASERPIEIYPVRGTPAKPSLPAGVQ